MYVLYDYNIINNQIAENILNIPQRLLLEDFMQENVFKKSCKANIPKFGEKVIYVTFSI